MTPHEVLHKALSEIAPLNDREWEVVKSEFKPVKYAKRERLLDIEKVANSYVFIGTGLARLYGYKDGEEKTLFFFKEGMFAGSIQSYLFDRPSELVLEAIEDIEGLEITKEGMDSVFQQVPNMTKTIMVYTQMRLTGLLHFFSSFVLDSPGGAL